MPYKDPAARKAYDKARYQDPIRRAACRARARKQRIACAEGLKAYYASRYKAHRAERLLSDAARRKTLDPIKVREYNRQYRANNAEAIATTKARWSQEHIQELRAAQRAWRLANRGKCTAYKARHKVAKLHATPPWLTRQQLVAIDAVYVEAARLQRIDGIERNVDHIYPLQGKAVCGLHVPWNLQILTAKENRRKHNKMPVISRI